MLGELYNYNSLMINWYIEIYFYQNTLNLYRILVYFYITNEKSLQLILRFGYCIRGKVAPRGHQQASTEACFQSPVTTIYWFHRHEGKRRFGWANWDKASFAIGAASNQMIGSKNELLGCPTRGSIVESVEHTYRH